MTDNGNVIVRVAGRGDGVTQDGRHVPGAAPGDVVLPDGGLERGPHYQVAPCRHFGTCGGCTLQHLDDDALAQFVTGRIANAAASQGVDIGVMAPASLSPPYARRRTRFHVQRTSAKVMAGFREPGSHRIVDLDECPVLHPELFALLQPIRGLLEAFSGRITGEIELTLADQGVAMDMHGIAVEGLAAAEAVADFARKYKLARLSVDQGYGPETLWEPEPVTITLGRVPVSLAYGVFLQATKDGEAALIKAARDWLQEAGTIADLFSGLGTFAFGLGTSAKVLVAEAAQNAHLACKNAAARWQLPVFAMHRDLFRNPLTAAELNRFDGVILDPPRAGARDQVRQLAMATDLRAIVYISCNPATWARDAATLVSGGYFLKEVRPVGQFRWSTHVELASLFVRG